MDGYADTRIEIHALICKKFKISPGEEELITIIRAIVEKKKQKRKNTRQMEEKGDSEFRTQTRFFRLISKNTCENLERKVDFLQKYLKSYF